MAIELCGIGYAVPLVTSWRPQECIISLDIAILSDGEQLTSQCGFFYTAHSELFQPLKNEYDPG